MLNYNSLLTWIVEPIKNVRVFFLVRIKRVWLTVKATNAKKSQAWQQQNCPPVQSTKGWVGFSVPNNMEFYWLKG